MTPVTNATASGRFGSIHSVYGAPPLVTVSTAVGFRMTSTVDWTRFTTTVPYVVLAVLLTEARTTPGLPRRSRITISKVLLVRLTRVPSSLMTVNTADH